jgi:hypothetical protein
LCELWVSNKGVWKWWKLDELVYLLENFSFGGVWYFGYLFLTTCPKKMKNIPLRAHKTLNLRHLSTSFMFGDFQECEPVGTVY